MIDVGPDAATHHEDTKSGTVTSPLPGAESASFIYDVLRHSRQSKGGKLAPKVHARRTTHAKAAAGGKETEPRAPRETINALRGRVSGKKMEKGAGRIRSSSRKQRRKKGLTRSKEFSPARYPKTSYALRSNGNQGRE